MAELNFIIGEKINSLTVLARIGSKPNNIGRKGIYWLCKCECGNEVEISASRLRNGDNKSCGCLRTKTQQINLIKGRIIIDYQQFIGQKFERLLVLEYLGFDKSRHDTILKCICNCGVIVETAWQGLRTGGTKSCGCLKKEMGKVRLTGQTWSRKEKGEGGFQTFLRYLKNGAKTRALAYELTDEQVKEISIQNCYYCDTFPNIKTTTSKDHMTEEGIKHSEYIHNGIDRLDNGKGYILNNCVACCTTCNIMKMTLGEQEFYKHIERIYNNTKDRIINETQIQAIG
jgi:hypothetical protein